MKKRFNVNISNRFAYSLITVLLVLLIGVSVYAFGTSNPSSFGHSAKELDFSGGVEGNVVFNGSVGIGTNNPQVKLDVAEDFKIGNTGLSCDSNIEGSLRYNSIDNIMEFCDGISWKGFSPSCTPGIQNYSNYGNYELSVLSACEYSFTVIGGGGGRSNGAAGGSVVINNYIPPSDGTLYIQVGGPGIVPTGGYGGGGNGVASFGGYGGGGASAIRFESTALVISGGGGGGGPNGGCGGVGGTGSGGAGGSGNGCGGSSGAPNSAGGQGGCQDVGSGTGGSYGNFDPLLRISTGGPGGNGRCGGNAGGGSGFGGGGGAQAYEGRGGGGGGGYVNLDEITSFTPGVGPGPDLNGSVIISWVAA